MKLKKCPFCGGEAEIDIRTFIEVVDHFDIDFSELREFIEAKKNGYKIVQPNDIVVVRCEDNLKYHFKEVSPCKCCKYYDVVSVFGEQKPYGFCRKSGEYKRCTENDFCSWYEAKEGE